MASHFRVRLAGQRPVVNTSYRSVFNCPFPLVTGIESRCRPIHSLALRATNGQNRCTPRKIYYAAKSAGCLTLAFCVTSTKQRRTEPNVGGDRPRQPAVDGGSRTLGRAPRWGANVAWGSLPRVRCATLGYDVQPRCGCREGHCQILELGTWNLEPALGLTGEASAGFV